MRMPSGVQLGSFTNLLFIPLRVVSDRPEPDMSFELFEPDKSPVQLNPDFWLEPMSRTLRHLSFKKQVPYGRYLLQKKQFVRLLYPRSLFMY